MIANGASGTLPSSSESPQKYLRSSAVKRVSDLCARTARSRTAHGGCGSFGTARSARVNRAQHGSLRARGMAAPT